MKPIKKPSVQIRRKFDPTFKREAVQNRLSSGKSAEVIGPELGIRTGQNHAEVKKTSLEFSSKWVAMCRAAE